MEKDILVHLNSTPVEYLTVQETNTILSIKKYLQKYENVKVQMYINDKNELKVFDTNQYDNITLESVWKKMQDSTIFLSSYIQNLTGNKDVDMKILNELNDVDLYNFCLTSKKSNVSNEAFWMYRTREKYPDVVKYFKDYSLIDVLNIEILNINIKRVYKWKDLYLQTNYYVKKMKENNFDYTNGDPKIYYILLTQNTHDHLRIKWAATLGYIDLLEHFNYSSFMSSSLFLGAARGNQMKVIEHFQKYWESSSAEYGLLGAVWGGNLDMTKYFLEKGARNVKGNIKLALGLIKLALGLIKSAAVWGRNLDMSKYIPLSNFLEKGAINIKDNIKSAHLTESKEILAELEKYL